jgi:hypothetical protein
MLPSNYKMTFRICHGFTNPAMEEKDTRWSAVLESKGLLHMPSQESLFAVNNKLSIK